MKNFVTMTSTYWRALIKVLDVISLLTLLYSCVSHECQAIGNGVNILKLNALEKQHSHSTGYIHEKGQQKFRLQQWTTGKLKRGRRENHNTTKQMVQCEVASLSCRNCCGSLSNCTHKTAFCRCDSQCTFYNDCCVDFETFCEKTQETSFEVEPQQLSCIKLPNTGSESGVSIWTVNKCPKTKLFDEIVRNCESAADETGSTTIQKFTPVVAAENNLTFRNEFCAKCNGFEKFEYFDFKIRCDVIPPAVITSLEELLEFAQKYCENKKESIFWEVNNQPVRECNQYFRHVCPTLKELDEKCLSTYLYFSLDKCVSRRHWCNLNISKWDDWVYDKCESSLGIRKSVGAHASRHAPFTVALHLSTSSLKVEKTRCTNGLFYDSYLQTCRYGESISSPMKGNIDKFDVVVWLDIREMFFSLRARPDLNETISSLARLFSFDLSQVSALQHIPIMDQLTQIVRLKLELTSEQTLLLGKANLNTTLSTQRNMKKNLTNNLPLQRLLFFTGKFNMTFSKQMTATVFKTSSRQLACIKKHTYLQGDYISIENGKYYHINSTGKMFIKSQVFFEENNSISVCELVVFSTCVGRRINLTIDEYVKFENLSIFYNRTKTIYDFGEYDIEDGHVFMCISEPSSTLVRRIPSDSMVITTYLTLIGFILSLIGLFLVIQTYLIFPELRNLPGKNILSLSFSLFLVQLLWLIPDGWYSSSFCYVIAVMKHYLFLVSFVAMATIAWDTHSTFARKEVRKRPATENVKKFYLNSVIVWGLPAIFVVSSATADQTDIYAVYVNELWCWFVNEQAQKYLFVLPVGLLLLFNVVLFVLTVFRIKHVHSRIYLKISTLMGFCWLFGFIDVLVKNLVFSYLFVIFASLQGVYIALAFVVKRSVWGNYKKLLKREQSSKFHPDYRSTLIEGLSKSRETRV